MPKGKTEHIKRYMAPANSEIKKAIKAVLSIKKGFIAFGGAMSKFGTKINTFFNAR